MSEPAVGTSSHLISKHLNTPIPKTLWHYTSVSGALGIIESSKIFATEVHFLNDKEEFYHAEMIARRVVEELAEEIGEFGFPARRLLQMGLQDMLDRLSDNARVFVACFTEAADQLSQWRGYSGGSSGVSLGFDLEALRPSGDLADHTAVVFAPCVYSEEAKTQLVTEALLHAVERARSWWDNAFSKSPKEDHAFDLSMKSFDEIIGKYPGLHGKLTLGFQETTFAFLKIAALLKHKAFYEEREWRLVLPILAGKLPTRSTLQFNAGRNCIKGRIAFSLVDLPGKPKQKLPLNDLLLGPGSHESAAFGISMLLQTKGATVKPRHSDAPYREA